MGFDSKSLEVTSEPVPVLEGVVTKRSGAADFGAARDGSLVYVDGAGSGDGLSARTMVWVDRQGREEVLAAPPRPYNFPRLSPDGSRLAVFIQDQDLDLWIRDFARETLTRLTFGPEAHVFPVWTPDALRVAFASGGDLFWKSADGTGDVERLNESASSQSPRAFSPDGKYLVFQEGVPGGGTDLGVLSLEDGMSGAPLVATEFNELNADLSPDGRYVAYQSDESGRFEVYVRPFPDVEGGRWQISNDGGTRPLWARGGGELFYVTLEGASHVCPRPNRRGVRLRQRRARRRARLPLGPIRSHLRRLSRRGALLDDTGRQWAAERLRGAHLRPELGRGAETARSRWRGALFKLGHPLVIRSSGASR